MVLFCSTLCVCLTKKCGIELEPIRSSKNICLVTRMKKFFLIKKETNFR